MTKLIPVGSRRQQFCRPNNTNPSPNNPDIKIPKIPAVSIGSFIF